MPQKNLFKKNLPKWLKVLDISEKKIITRNLRKYDDVIFYGGEIYPERQNIFKAFSYFERMKQRLLLLDKTPITVLIKQLVYHLLFRID